MQSPAELNVSSLGMPLDDVQVDLLARYEHQQT